MKIQNKRIDNAFAANGITAKALSVLYIMALVVGTIAIIESYDALPFSGTNYTLQNIGRGLAITQIVLVVTLTTIQRDVYWWLRRKTTHLDERQEQVRRRIVEKSYKHGTIVVTAFVAWVLINEEWIIEHMNFPYGGDLDWLPISLVVLLYGLPALIASWQKDSS